VGIIPTSSRDMNDSIILTLYSQPQTVFTLDEISLYFPKVSYENLRSRIRYFTNVGKLQRLHQGIYAKIDYNPLELANKLYAPSYISLETVLARGGVTFQYYETVFVVSYLTREVTLKDVNIQYRQIKRGVLTNLEGVFEQEGYFIASLERAFLDAVYIYKNYHFDNLSTIDWEKVDKLKKIYKSKAFEKRVEEYYQHYQEDFNVK